jgi:formate hydrogenlyase subunit 4
VNILAAMIAQLLHLGLVVAAAPTILGLLRWVEARLAGRPGADPWQPWRELARLIRKQPVLAENASSLFLAAPAVCLAATLIAAALVPSFTLGMALGPIADLLVIGGLLAVARASLALAALDAGTGAAGLAAARGARLGCLAEPALFLVILALGWLGGTTNADLLAGLQQEGTLQPPAASALAAVALALLAIATSGDGPSRTEFSATDLAILEFSDALRLIVWFDLLAAMFLPLGIAAPDAGLLAWVAGLIAWLAKLGVLALGLAVLRHTIGDTRLPARPVVLLQVAAMLGLLAIVLVLASAASA